VCCSVVAFGTGPAATFLGHVTTEVAPLGEQSSCDVIAATLSCTGCLWGIANLGY
jgi:hypothetical protein